MWIPLSIRLFFQGKLLMKISVNIPDAVLRGEIEKVLGKVPGVLIPPAEMATLTKLDTRRYEISNLTGLEFATNLKTLYLRSIDVLDLTSLKNLTNLETLDFRGADVSDITPLSNLTNLEYLNLSDTDILDITPMSNLTKLQIDWE